MPNVPLLSILVPTKNRSECARHAIASILSFQDRDFELVVHDNGADGKLQQWIEQLHDDPRLKYSRTEGPLSISQNFERTIDCSTGRYLAALGDDDGVNPCIVDVCRWLKANDIDALTPKSTVRYLWPGVKPGPDSKPDKGRLSIGAFSGRLKVTRPDAALRRCVQRGAGRLEGLPTLYHGIVKRSCLEKVQDRTGHWLPGVSPDMAAAVALTSHVNQVALLDYPVFVPGASPNSGAGRGVKKTHHGDLRDEAFLDRHWVEAWPQGVPRFFSGPTMWAAAAIQALRATGRNDLADRFNYAAVHAACLVFVPQRRRETLQSLGECVWASNRLDQIRARAVCTTHIALAWSRRLQSKLSKIALGGGSQQGLDPSDIAQAMQVIQGRCAPLLVRDKMFVLGSH
jgi:hypothetical protein